jgi:hypothetical protein
VVEDLAVAGGIAAYGLAAATIPAIGVVGATTAQEILQPAGQMIGSPGTSETIRELQGGLPEAQALFGRLCTGGTQIAETSYPGALYRLANGGTVGLRLASKSGGPAIDVNIPGVDVTKIHFGQ